MRRNTFNAVRSVLLQPETQPFTRRKTVFQKAKTAKTHHPAPPDRRQKTPFAHIKYCHPHKKTAVKAAHFYRMTA